MSGLFRPAVKEQLKARVAFCGPTGSGKTWTALGWAEELAQGERIALIDTERRSASLYAAEFTFDKLDWAPPYDPAKLVDAIHAAEQEGYAVLIIDSLTHFWTGEGGTLEVVDRAANRNHGNKFVAWGIGTPLQRKMVDAILAANMHVIVTMRSKMEYALEEDDRGKKQVRKIGMAPEQRAGIEYEFTIVGDLDHEHRIAMTKSRCAVLADQVVQPHFEREAAKQFLHWLEDGEPLASADDRKTIADALRALPEDVRKATAERVRAEYGPANLLLAKNVDEVLATIKAAAPPCEDDA